MNGLTKFGYRVFQKSMWVAMWFLPWHQNKGTLSGAGSIKQLPKWIKEKEGCTSALIVTDGGLYKLGIRKPFRKGDERQKVRVDQLISHISADTAHRVAPQITFA